MPPIWTQQMPIIHIDEELDQVIGTTVMEGCDTDTIFCYVQGIEIFKVTAQDGDRSVNNSIRYSLQGIV